MKTILGVKVIESIDDFLQDDTLLGAQQGYYDFSAEKDADFINEPERAERCHKAAEEGCDGKLHSEVIEDFREFGAILLDEAERAIGEALDELPGWNFGSGTPQREAAANAEVEALSELAACKAAFVVDCDECEQYHKDHGTYGQQVG